MVVNELDATGLCVYRSGIVRCALDEKTWSLKLIDWNGRESVLSSTGIEDAHDVLYFDSAFYVVSSGTNSIQKVSHRGELERTYEFPGTGDAWHLNCLAIVNGRIVACAFGEFANHRGYKGNSMNSGFLFDLESGSRLWEGLSQPHTPVQDGDRLFVCDSETRRLLVRNPDGTTLEKTFDGYIRGIAIGTTYAYLGLSCSRNIDTALYSKTAKLLTLDKQSLEPVGEIDLPFPEIYAIAVIEPALATTLQRIAGTMSQKSLLEIRRLRQLLRHAERVEIELSRLNAHPIVGRVLRILRFIKRDDEFGALPK